MTDTNIISTSLLSANMHSIIKARFESKDYSILNKIVEAIRDFFSNDDARQNPKTHGIYDALKKCTIKLTPDENYDFSKSDDCGFYNCILTLDKTSFKISLRIGKNNHLHLQHRNHAINMHTGERIAEKELATGREDVSFAFISHHFTRLLENAISTANGIPPDYSIPASLNTTDAGLITTAIRPAPMKVCNKDRAYFNPETSQLTGCYETNNTLQVQKEITHSNEPAQLAQDLLRLNSGISLYINVNGQNIDDSQIKYAIENYSAGVNSKGAIDSDAKAMALFGHVGDHLKKTYGDTLFGKLTSEQGVLLIAMANNQGVATQSHQLCTDQLNNPANHFTPEILRVTPNLKGASQKYIAVDISANHAAFRVMEKLKNSPQDSFTLFHYHHSPEVTLSYKAEELTRWAICNKITFFQNVHHTMPGPGFDRFTFGYTLKLNEQKLA